MASCFRQNYQRFPNERFIGIYDIGGCPVYLIRDPALIYRIANKDSDFFMNRRICLNEESDPLSSRALFLSKGQRWRDLRTLISSGFSGNRTKLMLEIAIQVIEERCKDLRANCSNELNENIYDMNDLLKKIIGDAIGACAFGVNVNSIKEPENEFFKLGCTLANFKGIRGFKFLAYSAFPGLMNFLKIPLFNECDRNYYWKTVTKIFKERELSERVNNDLIDHLIEVKTGKSRIPESNCNSMQPIIFNKRINETDLIAQPFSFFFGGFSSLSLSLGFALHEIAINPNIQQKLYAEIKIMNEKLNGNSLTFEEIGNLKYTDMIASESLRRWPVALVTDRRATKPYIMENTDGTKVKLNPGDSIWFLLDAIAMDPTNFANPEKFDPERFSEINKKQIPANCYMPFGSGPRGCVASRFALLKFKAMLYYIVLNFQLSKCDRTQEPLSLAAGSAFVEPENGFWLKIIPRKQNLF